MGETHKEKRLNNQFSDYLSVFGAGIGIVFIVKSNS